MIMAKKAPDPTHPGNTSSATTVPGWLENYLGTLIARGNTYHDIGMIWGARMLSPTGIFADENADVDAKPTSRHMIFLTDGQTETFDEIRGRI